MKKTELLAPAGSFDTFKKAIYSGADAVYLATEKYGARAYAKNLTLDELKEALVIAHALDKKIYVTVNTIIKTSELSEVYSYIDTLYEMGVDGLILADFALVKYVIDNLPDMEAHISTQMGVKDLEDVKFFESINAKRCVLARENTIDEIKMIKENSKMPLEVFAHGALCVSYSGGCLMSSMIGSRSGNRGRCAQSCRKEYTIYKNNEAITKKGYFLSMKDLNTSNSLYKLLDLNIDSLKIEGRMKNSQYVKTVTEEYRNIIDSYPKRLNANLDNIFHRTYTEGFLFGEDNGHIVNSQKQNNEGELVGFVKEYKNGLIALTLTKSLNVNDRIRIDDNEEIYFTIDAMLDAEKKPINRSDRFCYLNVRKPINEKAKVYKMVDSTLDLETSNQFKKGLEFFVSGHANEPLSITAFDGSNYYSKQTKSVLVPSDNRPLTNETLKTQLSKLNDTPFYLELLSASIDDNLFMSLKDINEARREIIEDIINSQFHSRNKKQTVKKPLFFDHDKLELAVFVSNIEQYNVALAQGVKIIYFKNYSPYVKSDYPTDEKYTLIGNYGAINRYHNRELIADASFNAFNEDAIYELFKTGVSRVTLSQELAIKEINELTNSYIKKYGGYPNLEMICYGHQKLMTTKYCPLKSLGECGKCKDNSYYLTDGMGKFYITHQGCITNILNGNALNLIDDIYEIAKYVNVVRLNFTIESKAEVKKIINEYQEKIKNPENRTNLFDQKENTRGYYKRPIL